MQADVTKLEQQLEQAKKGVETNTARVTELEKELKALDAPAKDAAPANDARAKTSCSCS
jgi:cell division protein FtsB